MRLDTKIIFVLEIPKGDITWKPALLRVQVHLPEERGSDHSKLWHSSQSASSKLLRFAYHYLLKRNLLTI